MRPSQALEAVVRPSPVAAPDLRGRGTLRPVVSNRPEQCLARPAAEPGTRSSRAPESRRRARPARARHPTACRQQVREAHTASRKAKRGEKQGSGAQRKPIRFGGQYTKKTSPIRFFRGTEPHERESQELARLSPMKK